mmetsp:Transcript_70043/g.126225  ORF Transcript_70043/g.126225 Transcript_70043/m.126225 type:complete len:250 (-) Transcript_70043:91-840(-)
MALLTLSTELQRALGELAGDPPMSSRTGTIDDSEVQEDSFGGQFAPADDDSFDGRPTPLPKTADDCSEKTSDAAFGSNFGLLWRQGTAASYCSTAATPLASQASTVSLSRMASSGETTPPLLPLQEQPEQPSVEAAKLLSPPLQIGLLPGGQGHFLLGATCLQACEDQTFFAEVRPLHERIAVAQAAEASLESDLLNLSALNGTEEDSAQEAKMDAAALARESLQSRGAPGLGNSLQGAMAPSIWRRLG